MFEGTECSELQQFNSQKHFITRQAHTLEGRTHKYEQISTLSIHEFIKTSIKETNSTDHIQIQNMKQLVHDFFDHLRKKIEKEISFSLFMAEMKRLVQQHVRIPNNTSFTQNTYLSFCHVFLNQCVYYILTLLRFYSLTDVNQQLHTPQCLLIALKLSHTKSEFVFTLKLGICKKQQNTRQPSNSKSKDKAQNEKRVVENEEESPSYIEPLIKKEISQEAILMEYFKTLFPTNNFVILVSPKPHIYLITRTQKLGQGGFGSVFKAEKLKLVNWQYQRSFWAIKELRKSTSSQQGNIIGQNRQHEILMSISKLSGMKSKNSNNIIQVQEVINFENKKYIVYELCPYKDLKRFIKTNTEFTKKHLFMIIEQLASTLDLIHYELIKNEQDMEILNALTPDGEIASDNNSHFKDRMYLNSQVGIIHRDLKLNNILVSYFSESQIRIKIIDWAFSKRTLTQQRICAVYCGTLNYQAPEILNKKPYCCKVDVWAFGVIAFELFTGKQFIYKDDKEKIKKDHSFTNCRLQKMQLRDNKKFNQQEILYWKKFICKCLQYNPEKRFTSKEALSYIRNCDFYKPWAPKDIYAFQKIRMMKANYFYHHTCIMQLKPSSSIRIKVLNKMYQQFQSAIQVIQQKFIGDKYWASEKPEITLDHKKLIRKYKQKQCNKESFEQSIMMLQLCSLQQYPQSKAFKELVAKVKEIYSQLS